MKEVTLFKKIKEEEGEERLWCSLQCTHSHSIPLRNIKKNKKIPTATDPHKQHTNTPPTGYTCTQSIPCTLAVPLSLSCQSWDSIPCSSFRCDTCWLRRGELSIGTFHNEKAEKEITTNCGWRGKRQTIGGHDGVPEYLPEQIYQTQCTRGRRALQV